MSTNAKKCLSVFVQPISGFWWRRPRIKGYSFNKEGSFRANRNGSKKNETILQRVQKKQKQVWTLGPLLWILGCHTRLWLATDISGPLRKLKKSCVVTKHKGNRTSHFSCRQHWHFGRQIGEDIRQSCGQFCLLLHLKSLFLCYLRKIGCKLRGLSPFLMKSWSNMDFFTRINKPENRSSHGTFALFPLLRCRISPLRNEKQELLTSKRWFTAWVSEAASAWVACTSI